MRSSAPAPCWKCCPWPAALPIPPAAPAGDTLNLIRHQNAPDLAKTARAGAVQPFAPKTETIVIDLRRLVSGQDPALNLPVKNGDVIHVPFAGTAYVLGGVRKPGNIAVKENLTVSQAVAYGRGARPHPGDQQHYHHALR